MSKCFNIQHVNPFVEILRRTAASKYAALEQGIHR
jgi:hypothetical protein